MITNTISMTIEITIDTSPDAHGDTPGYWEIEREATNLVRKAVKEQALKFNVANDGMFTNGSVRMINTTVAERGEISYVNAEPLTMTNALSMWNNMARDVNVFDNDWEIVKSYKELMSKSEYKDSVWSLPEIDETTFRMVFHTLRDDYKERSTTLLWSSLRSSVCSFLSNRMEDNLYTLPEPVTPEPF